ncbi:MAG: efflux RND transporter periplasmic adaptor subunit [Methylococcales bacterium]|nr:efflux RND transporter periplasmic adaptor subunit [Methylococcales bacterium]
MPQQRKTAFLCSLLATILLSACSDSVDKTKEIAKAASIPGEVFLAEDSPKKAYIKTATLALSQHPLLEPLVGKTSYDEKLTSRISSPVTGRVIATPITLGTPVKTGTTLLELDSPDVASAEADYSAAEADFTLAQKAWTRQQELYAGKAISQKDLEQAQNALNEARSALQRAQQRLKNLHINSGLSDGHFSLRSPISGIVVERNVNPGMEVRPDLDKPLYVVSDLKKLTLLMEVFEVNLSKIKLGQKLSVSVPAFPGVVFPSSVQYITQILDENTRTVQVRCDLPNADGRLLPGMYATITVNSDPDDQAIVIPLTAIFTEGDADYVFVALEDHHYKQRPVNIGLRLKDKAIITGGLQANEQVVIEGALTLRAEEEVEIDSNSNKAN